MKKVNFERIFYNVPDVVNEELFWSGWKSAPEHDKGLNRQFPNDFSEFLGLHFGLVYIQTFDAGYSAGHLGKSITNPLSSLDPIAWISGWIIGAEQALFENGEDIPSSDFWLGYASKAFGAGPDFICSEISSAVNLAAVGAIWREKQAFETEVNNDN